MTKTVHFALAETPEDSSDSSHWRRCAWELEEESFSKQSLPPKIPLRQVSCGEITADREESDSKLHSAHCQKPILRHCSESPTSVIAEASAVSSLHKNKEITSLKKTKKMAHKPTATGRNLEIAIHILSDKLERNQRRAEIEKKLLEGEYARRKQEQCPELSCSDDDFTDEDDDEEEIHWGGLPLAELEKRRKAIEDTIEKLDDSKEELFDLLESAADLLRVAQENLV